MIFIACGKGDRAIAVIYRIIRAIGIRNAAVTAPRILNDAVVGILRLIEVEAGVRSLSKSIFRKN